MHFILSVEKINKISNSIKDKVFYLGFKWIERKLRDNVVGKTGVWVILDGEILNQKNQTMQKRKDKRLQRKIIQKSEKNWNWNWKKLWQTREKWNFLYFVKIVNKD